MNRTKQQVKQSLDKMYIEQRSLMAQLNRVNLQIDLDHKELKQFRNEGV